MHYPQSTQHLQSTAASEEDIDQILEENAAAYSEIDSDEDDQPTLQDDELARLSYEAVCKEFPHLLGRWIDLADQAYTLITGSTEHDLDTILSARNITQPGNPNQNQRWWN